jgi:DNA-directed RNA polymerase II subunit RPB1
MKIAKNITKPVVVNKINKSFLKQLVLNGPDIHPGAKILERKNGESITLRYVDRASIVLEEGDIVHRHMMNGDPILFNRQPTLHRMSMMCHIARIMTRGDTFRMNVADTKPYNADQQFVTIQRRKPSRSATGGVKSVLPPSKLN